MTVGTSINDEVDGIRAPTMWLTHQFNGRMAANWSFFERVTLRATVRCKLDTRKNHWDFEGIGQSRCFRHVYLPGLE